MAQIEKDGTIYVEWDEKFHANCTLAGTDQDGINAAMVAGKLHAIHEGGKWFYALYGLNHYFPLPEGRGWQD